MSLMLISLRPPENGIPLSTIKGSLLPVNERTPRIRIEVLLDPGLVLVVVICTPGARPCKAC